MLVIPGQSWDSGPGVSSVGFEHANSVFLCDARTGSPAPRGLLLRHLRRQRRAHRTSGDGVTPRSGSPAAPTSSTGRSRADSRSDRRDCSGPLTDGTPSPTPHRVARSNPLLEERERLDPVPFVDPLEDVVDERVSGAPSDA